MGVRDQVARIIDRHQWSRLDGGTYGQQIAADLAAKGLLRIQEKPEALHRIKAGDVILVHFADVIPEVQIPVLYEITEPEELDDGTIELTGRRAGNPDAEPEFVLRGAPNLILRKVVD